ncbi:TonB-dependent receptor plug domain-containing protein [Hymenobacter sp. H14-R3]|uniref:TonB-dependent receptor family protein n=1 Tax=Hymenobacter sp. H14-R3 TaxID=3046308 RepID=UPI0024B9C452|nr:TonB-dependent receptor [Hymenobacter sp. H14-R3]MDJ0364672.1 TonB-dependent receptor plug domain-containing protein [Hymenobacter sp. H14-R3]
MPLRYSLATLLPLLTLPALRLAAQQAPAPADTLNARALPTATVVGYGQRLPLRRMAAGVGVVDNTIIERFNENSLASAVNTLPGVRLEERATASYRISVRGSTLRSPFGVRNVKMYYFDIPFTEANGTSPLNLLDPAQIGRIEVLKGPAGSVYGAGTGGVVRLENRRPTGAAGTGRTQVGYAVGSYGLRRFTATAEANGPNGDYWRAQYAHQQLAGYRQQSALRREVFALDGQLSPSTKQTLALHALYTDIDYQLPGGLTRAQAAQDPRQARPGTASAPGTVAQKTFYASQTGLLGATHTYRFSDKWQAVSTLYGRASSIQTPYLVDWTREARLEGGGRAALHYRGQLAGRTLRVQGGGEFQAAFVDSRSYLNVGGAPTTLRYDDEITTRTGFAFAQADYELPAGLLLTAGASYNRLRYQIARVSSAATNPGGYVVTQDFRPQVLPRVALLKEITGQVSAYASVSGGYSPPTEAELRPSDGTISRDLQAERGTSYEVGSRGTLLGGRLLFDVALFDLELRNTIVSRSNAQGIQLFANAGTTHQRGAEVAASGYLWQPAAPADAASPAAGLRAWASYAYNRFRFGSYESATGQQYGGNRLTGTAPHTLSAGLDFSQALGFYLSPTVSHQATLPLNDANTDYAAGYWVFSSRAGWRRTVLGRLQLDLYAGIENATDRRYSLGNDLNAFGGRYFQPAAGRNYYGGALVGWRW